MHLLPAILARPAPPAVFCVDNDSSCTALEATPILEGHDPAHQLMHGT
ncbi:hypothetical protein [Streptomyces sp. NPDC059256]